jgi:FAD dependent oxidoreductase
VPKIEKEVEAARSLGLPAEYHDEIPLPFPVNAAIGFADQAEFHPRKFLLPLVNAIPGDGSYVFENRPVSRVEEGDPCRVVSRSVKTVTARDVIVATNMPIINKGMFFARAEPSRGYALAMNVPQDPHPRRHVHQRRSTHPLRATRSLRRPDGAHPGGRGSSRRGGRQSPQALEST